MTDEGKKDINPTISIERKGKDAVISVRPTRTNITGQKPETALGEPEDLLRVGQTGVQDIRTATLLEQAWSLIRHTANKTKDGEALIDEEIKAFTDITDRLTQKGKDGGRALRLDMANMIVHVNDLDKDKKTADQNWKDLSDPKKAEAVREKNFEMGLLYNYIKEFGGDPAKLDWQVVVAYGKALTESYKRGKKIDKSILKTLAEATSTGNKNDLYQKLLARESYDEAKPKNNKDKRKWSSDQEKEKAFDRLLSLRQPEVTVDPVRFLERQFLKVVEDRLDAMRGEFNWTETDPNDPDKLVWALQFEKGQGFSRGLKLSLFAMDEYEDYFNGQGVVASFITRMGRKDYWEGKRRLDRACLAKALGLVEGETNDIYAELTQEKIQESGIDALAGAEAVGLWTIDENFTRAYDLLFASVEVKKDQEGYYFQPATLRGQIEAARKQKIPERSIEDAIKASLIFATDMVKNAPAKNRLFVTERFVEYYRAGKIVDETGRVHDLFSDGFGLTDSVVGKMGRHSPRNAVIDYAANTVDRRRLDLANNPDQRDEQWMSDFWLKAVGLRGIYGARPDPKEQRTRFNGDPATNFYPEDIVLPGNVEDYLDYNNTLTRDIGETNPDDSPRRTFIHRRALYEVLEKVLQQHEELKKKGAPGKPGYDEKFGYNVTLANQVKNILDKPEFKATREINVDIDDRQWRTFLLNVLRNPYSLGIMFSFNDWETVERMRRGYSIRRALEYEHKAMVAATTLRTELGLYPDRLPEHLGITSAAVKAAFTKAKGCRYAWSQLTRQAMPLYDFADTATLKLLAKTMPGQEQVEQAYSEAGQGVGYNTSEEYVRMLLNLKGKYTEARNQYLRVANKHIADLVGPRTYLGQSVLVNSMFIWQETDKRLSMIENGDQESADAATMAFILKERDSRAFTWQRARQVLWQARGFFWNRVGSLAKTGVEDHPVQMEQWRQLDITWEMRGGRLVDNEPTLAELNRPDGRIHTITIQDITDAEMELYFNVIEPLMPDNKTLNPDFARVAKIYQQLQIHKDFPPRDPYHLLSETKLLVFKGPEERKEFYMNRTTEVLNLFYGREGSYKITLPEKLYRRDGGGQASESDLIRQAMWIYEYAFSVERVNAYIEIEKIYIQSILDGKGVVETQEAVEKAFRAFQANEQLRPEDIELIEKKLKGYSEFIGNLQRGRHQFFHYVFHKKLAEIPVVGAFAGWPLIGGLIKDFSLGDVGGTALAMFAVSLLAGKNLAPAILSLKDLQGFTFTQLNSLIGGIPLFGEALAKTFAAPGGWLLWFFGNTVVGKLLATGVNLGIGKIFPAAPRAVPPDLYNIPEKISFKPKN